MPGKYKGVWSFIRKENPNVFLPHCCYHLLHIGADRGCQALNAPVEDLVIDVYYYLHKSSKRQQELKTFQELYDENVGQVIKHVHTRWLSLTPCLQRILNMWDSLIVYFCEQCHALQVKIFMKSSNKDLIPNSKSCVTVINNNEIYILAKATSKADLTRKKSETTELAASRKTQSRGMSQVSFIFYLCFQSEKCYVSY